MPEVRDDEPGEHDHPDDRAERDPEQEDLPRGGHATEQERAGPAERGRQDLAREPRTESDECCEDCHDRSIAPASLRSCRLRPLARCGGVAAAADMRLRAADRSSSRAPDNAAAPRSVSDSHTRRRPMPQKAWSDKRERQYEHIKDSYEDRGVERRRGRGARGSDGQQGARRARRDQGRQEAPSRDRDRLRALERGARRPRTSSRHAARPRRPASRSP